MPFQVEIHITLKPSIFDPAGSAIETSLHQLGYPQVGQVRVGKLITLILKTGDPTAAQEQVGQMCEQLLANPVIERYKIQIRELAEQ